MLLPPRAGLVMASSVGEDDAGRRAAGAADMLPGLPVFHVLRPGLALPERTADTVGEHPLVALVCASAGSGKTTLMTWWAHQALASGASVGWLTTSPEHRDAAALWTSVLTVLQASSRVAQAPTSGGARRGELASIRPPRVPDRSFAREVAQVLGGDEDPVWLFLDDLHVLPTSSQSVLRHLLQEAPPNLHLVLGSRAEPAIGLPRLRLAGALHEVRDADLRFDAGEAEDLLLGHGLQLARPHFEQLLRLTEGWAAGLRLAALSLADGRDVDAFLASFGAGDRSVVGYLVEEVMAGFKPETIRFLQDTCLPSTLTAGQAADLSGRPDAEAVLRRLTDVNALVGRLDGLEERYQYHSLLRAYLAADLRRTDPERCAQLHARTARWLLDDGNAAEALEHVVGSGDPELLHDVLRDVGPGLVMAGRPQVVLAAARRAAWARHDPVVAAVHALACLEAGQLDQADRDLDVIARALRRMEAGASSRGDEEAELRLLRMVLLHRDCVRRTLRADEETVAGLLVRAESYRAGHAFAAAPALRDLEIADVATLGLAISAVGPPERGEELLRAALAVAVDEGRDLVAMHCLVTLSLLAARTGDLVAMERWAHESIEFAVPRGWSSAQQLGFAYTLAAAAAYEHFDVEAADGLAARAVDVCLPRAAEGEPSQPTDEASVRSAAAIASYIAFDRADPGGRRRIVHERASKVEELGSRPFPPSMVAYELGEFQRMALEVGDLQLAARAVELAERLLGPAGEARVLRAAVHLHQGRVDDARAALRPVLDRADEPLVVTSRVSAWLLSACVAVRNRQPAAAHDALLHALDLAAPRRLLRLVLEAPPDVQRLLADGRGRFGPYEPFVAEALTIGSHRSAATGPRRPVVRPLTRTEQSLLRDLPSLLSVPELAAAHQVSPNTIKTQIRSIFTKLGVDSRRDAVDAARRLGLL